MVLGRCLPVVVRVRRPAIRAQNMPGHWRFLIERTNQPAIGLFNTLKLFLDDTYVGWAVSVNVADQIAFRLMRRNIRDPVSVLWWCRGECVLGALPVFSGRRSGRRRARSSLRRASHLNCMRWNVQPDAAIAEGKRLDLGIVVEGRNERVGFFFRFLLCRH